jgi:HK97 gp10 family phage protein
MIELSVNDGAVTDLKEAQKDIERKMEELTGGPMVTTMRTATLMIHRSAKINAPVDTGRLRASITPSVTASADMIQGVVGSNVTYAPYVELGTRPHWPPVSALETWARSHGTSAFLVARAIARRGTKARKFLQRAFEENQARIIAMIDRAVKKITES